LKKRKEKEKKKKKKKKEDKKRRKERKKTSVASRKFPVKFAALPLFAVPVHKPKVIEALKNSARAGISQLNTAESDFGIALIDEIVSGTISFILI